MCVFFCKVLLRFFSIALIRFAEKIDEKLKEKRDIERICENHPVNKLEGLGEIYDHIQKSTTHCIHLIEDGLWTWQIVFFLRRSFRPEHLR